MGERVRKREMVRETERGERKEGYEGRETW